MLSSAGKLIDDVLRELRETMQRYKYVSQEMAQRKQRLIIKEPEIRKCLDSVNLLIEQQEAGAESVRYGFQFDGQRRSIGWRSMMATLSCGPEAITPFERL